MSTRCFRRRNALRSIESDPNEKRRSQVRQRALAAEPLEARTLLTGLAWSTGPAAPAALGNAAALDIGTGVLLLGGATSASGASTPTSAYLYDPYIDAWTSAPSADQGRNGGGVGRTGSPGPIVISGGEANYKYASDIFQFGGANQGHAVASVSNYDPSPGGESTAAPAMSAARFRLAYATDQATGELYAIGGLDGAGSALASVERYDPSADAWSTIAALPEARYGASAASDGAGHILVFGGVNSAGALVNSVYSYTIANDTWSSESPMPQAASATAAVFGAYGQVYVIGGLTAGGAVSDVRVYNPVTDEWTAETPLPSAEFGAAAAIDADGDLDVMGGFNSANLAVATMYRSAALPAPVGLPAVPGITVGSNYWVYDGLPHAATAIADAGDGVTPVDGLFSFTYNGSATLPINAGTYNVVATFTSHDANFVSTVKQDTLVIDPATPTLTVSGGGTIAYDGLPHGITAAAVGVDGTTPVSGSVSYSYNGSSSVPVTPGTYTAVATFTSQDPNYTGASATTTIVIPDPTIPTGVTAAGASTNSIRVSWNPVAGAAYYNVYERHVLHSPKGSGSTIYYSIVAGGITDTSATITVSQIKSYTYYVTSVSASGVESPRSAPATGEPLFAPSLSSMLWNGAVTSFASVEVGQTLQVTLLGYGNEPPSYTMTSGPSTMSVDPTTGVVTYTPGPSEAGYVSASFQASNSLGTAAATFQFHVLAQPVVVVTGGSFTFDGNTHAASAVALGSDGVTPISGTFYLTYSPSAYPNALSTAPYAQAGTYLVRATFTSSDPNYGGASGTGMITINPAAPAILLPDAAVDYDATAHAVVANAIGVDGVTPVVGTFSYTYNGSSTPPTNPGIYTVVANFSSDDPNYKNGSATANLLINPPSGAPSLVAGRHLFYNQSGTASPARYDGNNSAINSLDDNAIATDKTAYIPGSGSATFANVSSYTKGINGVMIDLAGTHGTISADDFTFRVGNNNAPNTWGTAPPPVSISIRAGAGIGGSDRVEIVWANGAIYKQWLEVIVKANGDTGLAQLAGAAAGTGDVFFFGNAVGDSGQGDTSTNATVDTTDELEARNHSASALTNVAITNTRDYNRDAAVDSSDALVSRNNATTLGTVTKLLNVTLANASPDGGDSPAVASALTSPSTTSAAPDEQMPRWLVNRLESIDLNSGLAATFFHRLAEQNTPATRKLLVKIDEATDALNLEDSLLDSLLTDLGLDGSEGS